MPYHIKCPHRFSLCQWASERMRVDVICLCWYRHSWRRVNYFSQQNYPLQMRFSLIKVESKASTLESGGGKKGTKCLSQSYHHRTSCSFNSSFYILQMNLPSESHLISHLGVSVPQILTLKFDSLQNFLHLSSNVNLSCQLFSLDSLSFGIVMKILWLKL